MILFTAIAALTPIAVLIFAVMSFIRSISPRHLLIIKAIASLLIWGVLTFLIFLAMFMLVFTMYDSPQNRASADLKMNLIPAFITLLYAVAGATLIYWVRHKQRA